MFCFERSSFGPKLTSTIQDAKAKKDNAANDGDLALEDGRGQRRGQAPCHGGGHAGKRLRLRPWWRSFLAV